MNDKLDELESILKDDLDQLQREYRKAAEPIIRQLIRIQSLRPPAPFIVPMEVYAQIADKLKKVE